MNPVFLGINWQNVLRNFVLIMIGVMIAHYTASAQLPSDLITKQPAPACLDLGNTAPDSAKAIDGLNPELQAFKLTEMADLGHYNTAIQPVIQAANETSVAAITTFLAGNEEQGAGKIEPINLTDYNGTMVWF